MGREEVISAERLQYGMRDREERERETRRGKSMKTLEEDDCEIGCEAMLL